MIKQDYREPLHPESKRKMATAMQGNAIRLLIAKRRLKEIQDGRLASSRRTGA